MPSNEKILNAFSFFVEKIESNDDMIGCFFSQNFREKIYWNFGWGNKKDIINTGSQGFEKTNNRNFFITNFNGSEILNYNFEQNLCSNKNKKIEEKLHIEFEKKYSNFCLNLNKNISYHTAETEEKFREKIFMLQENAKKGNIWVGNLCHEIKGKTRDPKILFLYFAKFLQKNREHCGGICWTKEQKFASFSPETFLEQDKNILHTYPIKGTGEKDDLKNNDKEIAELTMITDLMRNDIGQIASEVVVKEKQSWQSLEHFDHTYAHIIGKYHQTIKWNDYKKLLPAGSISGCPKKKVVEILTSLEKFSRKFFSGTFGIKTDEKKLISNILIRTIFWENGGWSYPVGAGITLQSNPKKEWEETLLKAQILQELDW